MGLHPKPVWHNLANGGCGYRFGNDCKRRKFDFSSVMFTEEDDILMAAAGWEDSEEDLEDDDKEYHR